MDDLLERLRTEKARNGGQGAYAWNSRELCGKAADRIEALQAEVAGLVEANGILEDALQEAGDDYPGSSMQEWCQQQVKTARQALKGTDNAE